MSSKTSTGMNIDFNNSPDGRPPIIGIYGLPGSGKSFVLKALKKVYENDYMFIEGSDVIARLVPGGLKAFQALDEDQKRSMRMLAINTIVADCLNDRKPGVVTGHFMFWPNSSGQGVPACTPADLGAYTHIIYLKPDVEIVYERRLTDRLKSRPDVSVEDLRRWQEQEETQLRAICYTNGIVYSILEDLDEEYVMSKVTRLLHVFLHESQESHRLQSEARLDSIVQPRAKQFEFALVLDADKTLSPADSGSLFWKHIHENNLEKRDYLKAVFSSPLGYTSAAFLQAALMYEEYVEEGAYHEACAYVAERISLYPGMLSLLQSLRNNDKIKAVVVTCGLRLVWEKVLEHHGLSDTVKVIGGGPLTTPVGVGGNQIITAAVKARLVARLQQHHRLSVVAIGDSVLDLDMFAQADRAVVVVGDEKTRSRSMEKELARAIHEGRFSGHQAILAPGASPRLDTATLPLTQLGPDFLKSLVPGHREPVVDLTDLTELRSSKILATAMRDASNSGPHLRTIHKEAAKYLALNTLPDLLGAEEYMISHVQGHQVPGSRIADQDKTLIVALMRGGEPMALGVNEMLPAASFLHADAPGDLSPQQLQGKSTVIFVDSVVNSGKTIIDFLRHLKGIGGKDRLRIVVIAGVVQSGAIARIEELKDVMGGQRVNLVALRLSENKFTGSGGTDTGNRLYNTTTLKK